jgi:hypothetical protein
MTIAPALLKQTDSAVRGTTEKMGTTTITLEENIKLNETKIADLEQKTVSYREAIAANDAEIKRLKLENKRDSKRVSIVRRARADLESVDHDVIDQ